MGGDTSNSKPKAFLFDIGNVLLSWTPEPLVRALFETPEDALRFRTEAMPDHRILKMDRGQNWDELLTEIEAECPQHLATAIAYRERWIETVTGVIEPIVDLRDRLRAAGFPIYGLSNYGSENFETTRAIHPLVDDFDGLIVSAHVGRVKPEPEIYQIAIDRFALVPDDTLFIDDLEVNIQAAKSLGFRTHHFKGPEALLSQAEAERWLD